MTRYGALLLLTAFMLSPSASQAQDWERGREIAKEHCSRCHVIPHHNPFGGIGSTPSFNLLANLEDGLERFETFFDRRPHPNFVRIPGVGRLSEEAATLQPFELQPGRHRQPCGLRTRTQGGAGVARPHV